MRALRLVVISSLYCSLTYGQLITSPEAITLADSISTLRACVSYCIVDLFGGIGCDVNSCLCRPDMVTTADSWLSSCIVDIQHCSDVNDVDDATSALSSYCQGYYEEVGSTPAAAPATTTAAVSATTSTAATGAAPGGSSSEYIVEISLKPKLRCCLYSRICAKYWVQPW